MTKNENGAPDREALVRQFHDGRRKGKIVDVLDVFAPDAVLEDPAGGIHRGIREIAAAYAGERSPVELEVVSVRRTKDGLTATVRVRKAPAAPRTYRETFRFDRRRGRVRSLRVEPLAG